LVGDSCPCLFGYSTRVLQEPAGVGVISVVVFFNFVVKLVVDLISARSFQLYYSLFLFTFFFSFYNFTQNIMHYMHLSLSTLYMAFIVRFHNSN